MPKRAGHVLNRLGNLAKGAKRLLEHLSPQKTRKRPKLDASDDSEPEAVGFTSLSDVRNPKCLPEYKFPTGSGENTTIRSKWGRILLTTR